MRQGARIRRKKTPGDAGSARSSVAVDYPHHSVASFGIQPAGDWPDREVPCTLHQSRLRRPRRLLCISRAPTRTTDSSPLPDEPDRSSHDTRHLVVIVARTITTTDNRSATKTMDRPRSEDLEGLDFPDEFDDESLDGRSNVEDKSSSGQSGSDRFGKIDGRSLASSTDLSVTTRSNGSKCHSRFSQYENAPGAESEHHLLDLLSDSGFPMTQVNGQRKLGPPPGWTQPPPDPSCEVFVGKIPRNLYEHEIYPIFKKVGDIYEIRLMMDFSGTNRGYCFVMFTKAEYAKRAIKELNNYSIRPGKKIGVVASINNCRLWIGQLSSVIDPEIVIKKFYEMTDDVSKVAVYKYPNGHVRCALVSYKTHRAAAMARRRLLPERGTLFVNVEVSVDWAPPSMSFNNVVEIAGERDEAGELNISQTMIVNHLKRRGTQKRNGDDFLDKSIKNYLHENGASLSSDQRKSLESSLRLQKSLGRSGAFLPRRRAYRTSQGKLFDAETRERGCNRENTNSNRLRSISLNSGGQWNPKNRDINGNITSSKKPPRFSKENNEDFSKIPGSSVVGVKHKEASSSSPFKLLTKKGDPGPLSFNLFEHYNVLPAKKSEIACDQNVRIEALHGTNDWGKSVPNVVRGLETRSDGDLRNVEDNQLKFADEKFANFAEFGKWNSTESFVPRVDASVNVKDEASRGFHSNQRNFGPCPENGSVPVPAQPKIMPNFRVLAPLTNWNGNYIPAPNQVSQRVDENHVNFPTNKNVDFYASQNNPANGYSQNHVGNYCGECAQNSGVIQRQLYFPNEILTVHHQQQAPCTPQRDLRIFYGSLAGQKVFSQPGHGARAPNLPFRSLFSTSSFGDYHRFMPQIYSGNNEALWRPRPILNRSTATVGSNN